MAVKKATAVNKIAKAKPVKKAAAKVKKIATKAKTATNKVKAAVKKTVIAKLTSKTKKSKG